MDDALTGFEISDADWEALQKLSRGEAIDDATAAWLVQSGLVASDRAGKPSLTQFAVDWLKGLAEEPA